MSGYFYKPWAQRIVVLLFIFFSVWWGLYITSPPVPKSADVPLNEFSAERAFSHVEAIAKKPHMLGTPEHDSVYTYLLDELQTLGLNPRIQEGVSSAQFRGLKAAPVKNILARLEGTIADRTILLMAHYDSAPYAPGAADDASGIATILEIIRVIKAGEPLKNDLLILFTDGEELGLLGAEYFASSSDAANEVDLVLNLEARGSSGSSLMFETNSGNAKLIPLFAKVDAPIVANSLTYSIYNLLPNDTDFTVFKKRGVQGLNFAFIEDLLNYHTQLDNPNTLSLSSIQHQGENILGSLRIFGNKDFKLSAQSDKVYFNSPFGGLIYYPQSWSTYLAILTSILFVLILWYGYRREFLDIQSVVLGFFGYLGLLLISGLAGWFGWHFISEVIFPFYQWQQHNETYAYKWYLWLFLSVTMLYSLHFLGWIKHKINIYNLMTGIYLVILLKLFVLTFSLPAANYLLLWPLLACLIGWAFFLHYGNRKNMQFKSLSVISLSLFPVLFILPFYIKYIQVSLTSTFLAGSVVIFLLMLGLSFPIVDYIVKGSPRSSYAIIGTISLISFIGAYLNGGYSPTQKKQNSLIYATDQDKEKSYWLSVDHKVDAWTSNFLGSNPPDSTFPAFKEAIEFNNLLYTSAELRTFTGPEIEITDKQKTDSLAYITLRINPIDPTNAITFSLADSNRIREISLGEKILYPAIQPIVSLSFSNFNFTYFLNNNSPFFIHLTASSDTMTLNMKTISYTVELPRDRMEDYPQRPSDMMPKPFGFTNGTIWKKTVDIFDL